MLESCQMCELDSSFMKKEGKGCEKNAETDIPRNSCCFQHPYSPVV
jgi:hypothetical protein